jgi:hypothetical protein
VVIEHNLDVIKTADWIVDLDRRAARRGDCGTGVTPETVARVATSYTGQFLTGAGKIASPEPKPECREPRAQRIEFAPGSWLTAALGSGLWVDYDPNERRRRHRASPTPTATTAQFVLSFRDGTEVIGTPSSVDTHPTAYEVFLHPAGDADTEIAVSIAAIASLKV